MDDAKKETVTVFKHVLGSIMEKDQNKIGLSMTHEETQAKYKFKVFVCRTVFLILQTEWVLNTWNSGAIISNM